MSIASNEGAAVQDPRPDGGRARRVRLDNFGARELGFILGVFACVYAVLYLIIALPSGEWLAATTVSLACFGFYAVPACLFWLFLRWYDKFKIEINTDRLRVLDASQTGRFRPQWVDYHRNSVDSVSVQNEWLTVSDRFGHPLIDRRAGSKARKLRRALEHHYWC